MSGRSWTKQEEQFLIESWGTKSLSYIVNNLNRTKSSILNKKNKLKLGSFLESGDYVSFNQLREALGYSKSSWIEKSWIENRNLPIKYKKVDEKRFKVINLDEFWIWAKKNQTFLDFSKFERYALGKEPDWVEPKRQRDIINSSKFKTSKWTKDEDERLIFLVNQHKYTYEEIAKILQRKENAIGIRLRELNIKVRPVAKIAHETTWTNEEIQELKELIKKGYDYETIQSKLQDKGVRTIRNKVSQMYGTESLDRVRDNVDNPKKIFYSSRKKWTDKEKQTLEDMLWEGWSYKDIQKALPDRSINAIKKQKERMNIKF